jgi:DNA-directed RNA polymerase specialized sigma24 family protein
MAKDIISAYRNVCRDLKGLEAYKTVSHNRLKQAHQVVFKGKMPSSEMCYVPLDRALEDYNLAADDFNETVQSIESLSMAKVQMEQIIGTMSDAEQVVILMHVEQGLSLREVAEKSNYSYGWLREVKVKIMKKEHTKTANAS